MGELNSLQQDIRVNKLAVFTVHTARDCSPLQNDLIILLLYVQVLSLDGSSVWADATATAAAASAAPRTDNNVTRSTALSKCNTVSQLKFKHDCLTLIRKAQCCLRHFLTKLANAQQH